MTELDALIVDLDGVIRHWHIHELDELAASVGLTREQLGAIAFEQALITDAMTGALTAEAWFDEIGRRVADVHGCDAATLTAGFGELGWSLDEEMVELLREVRAKGRVKLALFSNASTKLEADLASCALDVEFDVVFNSARLRIAKPDPEAFRMVAGLLAVPVERCLFVDDMTPNVEGAREAGMKAEPFTGVAALRSVLDGAGLLS